MTGPEHEDEFEAYLRRRLPLHRRVSELERLEPPEDLDRIVLRKAGQAIESPPPAPVFRAPRWALPMGLAVTILLTMAVVLNFRLHVSNPQQALRFAARGEPDAAPAASTHARKVATPSAPTPAGNAAGASRAASTGAGDATAPSPVASTHGSEAATRSPPVAESPRMALAARAANIAPPVAKSTSTPPSRDSSALQPAGAPADPAAWLRRIDELRAQGKSTEAEREYQRFREAYPDYRPR